MGNHVRRFGRGNHVEMRKELHFPHSLGLLYSAFTYYTGFQGQFRRIQGDGARALWRAEIRQSDSRQLHRSEARRHVPAGPVLFRLLTGLRMTNEKFDALFGGPARKPEEPLDQFHMDIAASIQAVTEEIVLRLTRSIAAETGAKISVLPEALLSIALLMARYCATASSAHLDPTGSRRCWRRPGCGTRRLPPAQGPTAPVREPARRHERRISRTAPTMTTNARAGSNGRAPASRGSTTTQAIERAASDLADGKGLGWFQGRMEFGPRALGNRSILADPRSSSMQSTLNLKIKYRESFRPFAPAVLREDVVRMV